MLIPLPTPETALIIIDAKIADQKEVMVSELVQRAVNSSIAALITIKKSPAVRMTAGRVINFKSDPRNVLRTEKTSATQK